MDPNAYGDTENPLWIADLQFNHLLKRHTVTWDARLAKTFAFRSEPTTKWRIALGVRNLTDEYQDDLDQGPERDAGYVYGPRYPQSFYVTVGASF